MSSERRHALAYDVIILDLDDTLYPEQVYLHCAYRKIAAYLSSKYGVDPPTVFDCMAAAYAANGRKRLFDCMLARFSLPEDELPAMLRILRAVRVEGGLQMYGQAREFLRMCLAYGKELAVLTNGNRTQQVNKVEQLRENEPFFRQVPVFYSAEYKPKPDPMGLHAIIAHYHCPPGQALFIGDSAVDRQAACSAGIDFAFASDAFDSMRACPETDRRNE